jgi:hypothetical protein
LRIKNLPLDKTLVSSLFCLKKEALHFSGGQKKKVKMRGLTLLTDYIDTLMIQVISVTGFDNASLFSPVQRE